MVMLVRNLTMDDAKAASKIAVEIAKREAPKLSGAGAKSIQPLFDVGEFGVKWSEPYMWIQDQGARPFTMKSLQGKVIPMWISDPTGIEALKNPKAKTRTTASGVSQVLIFRKATNPGAPGRIALRAAVSENGRIAGQIAKGNVGVKWRFPGLAPRHFFTYALEQAAKNFGIHGSIKVGYSI